MFTPVTTADGGCPGEMRLPLGVCYKFNMDPPSSLEDKKLLVKEYLDLEEINAREAKSRAVVLEILGDIPDADIAPPKNVLFVCKLNPVTEQDDLKIIFSRYV